MWHNIFIGIALLMIFEGVIPFAAPNLWRRMILALVKKNNTTLRVSGFLD